jgi:hypothetical protein
MGNHSMARKVSKSTGQRPLRVGEEVRHALAQILERGDLRRLYLGTKALLEAAAAFGLRNAQEAEPKRWRFSQLVLIGISAA